MNALKAHAEHLFTQFLAAAVADGGLDPKATESGPMVTRFFVDLAYELLVLQAEGFVSEKIKPRDPTVEVLGYDDHNSTHLVKWNGTCWEDREGCTPTINVWRFIPTYKKGN